MKVWSVFVFCFLIVSCDQRQPVWPEETFQQIKATYPGMKRECLFEIRYGGIAAWRPEGPDCYDMLPAQRWTGLLEIGPETSNFCPAPAAKCDWTTDRHAISLSFSKRMLPAGMSGGVYRIKFIGRRTRLPGAFGHMGFAEHFVIADRLISLSKIPGEKYWN